MKTEKVESHTAITVLFASFIVTITLAFSCWISSPALPSSNGHGPIVSEPLSFL